MKDVMILKELSQIKAISQEYRIAIIDAFGHEPATAKMISDRLGEPHAKINYHIKVMVRVGILELVTTQVNAGIVEKYYRPVARDYVIDSSALNTSETSISTIEKASIALFEHIAKDFYHNVEMGGNHPPKKINHRQDVFLTPDEAKELNRMVNNIIHDYIEEKFVLRENTRRYSIASLIIPVYREKDDRLRDGP